MTDLPTVSVAMINRNYGRYLGQAVDSVLGHDHPPLELVVVDDGSTDSSREVLAAYGDRVRTVLTPNRGKGAATNTAVATCRGDVVALLDSDDLVLPGRLRRIAEAYAENPGVQWVWHDILHVRRDTLSPLPPVALTGFTGGVHDHRAAVARGRLPITTPATSALSWRRPFLTSLLPMADRTRSQDNYLKFLSLGLAEGFVITEALALQGIHEENAYTTSTGAERRHKQALRALDSAPGLRRHGLRALHHRTVAEALVSTRGGAALGSADRESLAAQVRDVGPVLAPWVLVAVLREVRRRLRSPGSTP